MVLYILTNLIQKQEYPEKFIDENVKTLYWEYMARAYEIEKASSYSELAKAMDRMRMEGSIEDIMDIYSKVINRLSSRDLSFFNEASCKSIFITLAHTDGIYLIASEREASAGYSDLYLKENVIYKDFVKDSLV